MNKLLRQLPPYEGKEPYLYFAMAEADSKEAGKLLRILMERGVRIWYCMGPAANADELRHRQERSLGAELTVIYLTEAACSDRDTKSRILVNQKYDRPILCLDTDRSERRLAMGLREDIPHASLYDCHDMDDRLQAVLHSEGFTQKLLGEPVKLVKNGGVGKLSVVFCTLAIVLSGLTFVGYRWGFGAAKEYQDEVSIKDPVLQAAIRQASGGKEITLEGVKQITRLPIEKLPEHWEDLEALPSLENILIPQELLTKETSLPEGSYTIVLMGGAHE